MAEGTPATQIGRADRRCRRGYPDGVTAQSDFEQELDQLLAQWDASDILTAVMRARIAAVGAIEMAQEYVSEDADGLGRAYELLGRDRTLEGLVIRYAEIFDDEIVARAVEKLAALDAAK